ncbi:hypothetical protein Leryth_006710 [Lithospermum erythrorhizon]|uniref:Uncharacterized protein n=1 Tax=Lithospermum erythrorhizon TaxID=34254 RepID=A0AAV3PXG1_LITER|nr:hypothetical protein Leryth_006710 [Lithospermum erythrorhizon]
MLQTWGTSLSLLFYYSLLHIKTLSRGLVLKTRHNLHDLQGINVLMNAEWINKRIAILDVYANHFGKAFWREIAGGMETHLLVLEPYTR